LLTLLELGIPPALVPSFLRLCLYSNATCSNTSTSNMFNLSFGFIRSLTYAKGSWSLGLKASSSLNTRQENRSLFSPCFLRIRALSGTSAKKNRRREGNASSFLLIDWFRTPKRMPIKLLNLNKRTKIIHFKFNLYGLTIYQEGTVFFMNKRIALTF